MNKSFVYNYLNRRNQALPQEAQELLSQEVFALKKKAAHNLRELVKQTQSNFEKNGAKVFIVKNKREAAAKVKELAGQAAGLVKSKSNTLDKLGLKEIFGDRLAETDLGAYIVSQIGGDSDHPVLPSIDLTAAEIAEKFKEKFKRDYPVGAKELVDVFKKEIREKILVADIGLTGANAVTAAGQIMLLENEGNISLITRLPKIHIAVCGVEKIVATAEEATKIAQAAAVWGTGQNWPLYISFIGGPSKTADIENELVTGVQGAQELYLILIEGSAYEKVGTELESMLYCIHCGACYDLCPAWNCGAPMPKVASEQTIFNCTLCQNCAFNCPAKIDWINITRVCRDHFTAAGKNTEHNLKMIENIRKFGNPFGEMSEGQTPTELFCC